ESDDDADPGPSEGHALLHDVTLPVFTILAPGMQGSHHRRSDAPSNFLRISSDRFGSGSPRPDRRGPGESFKEVFMAGKVKPIPEGYHVVRPYLSVKGAADAIEYYTKVFGATERMRMPAPDGKIGHAELQFGDSVVMLADENPEMGGRSPRSIGGTPVSI